MKAHQASLLGDVGEHALLENHRAGMGTDMGRRRPAADSDKFIDPRDAARAILGFCEDYPTMRIASADMKRRVY